MLIPLIAVALTVLIAGRWFSRSKAQSLPAAVSETWLRQNIYSEGTK